ncbi:MAG TPA: AraC family transcriptional regulator ligand-binding domain-containing protein, partial [Polyangiaceae bacterium]|nr:AraC family transcriptional regulator ligand-binding domain-containing protein [Polyangiaceae bacterium]
AEPRGRVVGSRGGERDEISVAVPVVRALVEVVDSFGVTQARLFEAAGVDEARMAEAFARFAGREFERLQCTAMDLTGRETLGFQMVKVSDGAFGVVAHVVAHAPSLRDALRAAAKFSVVLSDCHRIELFERVGKAQLRIALTPRSERADRMFAEFLVAGFVRLLRLCARGAPLGVTTHFEHTAPVDCSEHCLELGKNLYFEQRFTGITFRRELLDAVPIHHQPELYALLYEEAERSLERVHKGGRLADRLRSYLLTFKASHLPTMAEAARAFSMSPRSLRRRLADEGESYRTLTRDLLETSAARSLRDAQSSLGEVADALGFSDSSAFGRAFKRWTGITPATYKRS